MFLKMLLPHLQQFCASAQPCCLGSPLTCHCTPDVGDDDGGGGGDDDDDQED